MTRERWTSLGMALLVLVFLLAALRGDLAAQSAPGGAGCDDRMAPPCDENVDRSSSSNEEEDPCGIHNKTFQFEGACVVQVYPEIVKFLYGKLCKDIHSGEPINLTTTATSSSAVGQGYEAELRLTFEDSSNALPLCSDNPAAGPLVLRLVVSESMSALDAATTLRLYFLTGALEFLNHVGGSAEGGPPPVLDLELVILAFSPDQICPVASFDPTVPFRFPNMQDENNEILPNVSFGFVDLKLYQAIHSLFNLGCTLAGKDAPLLEEALARLFSLELDASTFLPSHLFSAFQEFAKVFEVALRCFAGTACPEILQLVEKSQVALNPYEVSIASVFGFMACTAITGSYITLSQAGQDHDWPAEVKDLLDKMGMGRCIAHATVVGTGSVMGRIKIHEDINP